MLVEYKCRDCEYATSLPQYLKKHMKTNHEAGGLPSAEEICLALDMISTNVIIVNILSSEAAT